jgi:molecular chaperone GrpE
MSEQENPAENKAPENAIEEEVQNTESQHPEDEAQEENDAEDLVAELEQARGEAEKNLNTAMRLQADMDNLRRRTEREVENAHKFALESFARELLSVADSIDMGLQSSDDADAKTLKEGMELTRKQFLGVIEKFGMEKVEAAGLKFDPEQHEAMTMIPNSDLPPNTVVEVIQQGYALNGRLLRPARVVVSTQA